MADRGVHFGFDYRLYDLTLDWLRFHGDIGQGNYSVLCELDCEPILLDVCLLQLHLMLKIYTL